MNAPIKVQEVEVHLGEARVIVPGEVAAMAYLEKVLDEQRPIALTAGEPLRALRPIIGSKYKDGEYMGVTLAGDTLCELVVVSWDFDRGPHEDALKWAQSLGATLPSRHDGLVLLANAKDRFQTDYYYWCEELPAGDPGCAWCQSVGDGDQGWDGRGNRLRAVAVRRYPIQ